MNGKITSYLGFAKKSGNLAAGTTAVGLLRRAELIIVCRTASENSRKTFSGYMRKFGCAALETATATLEEITGKENCKVVAITDRGLAEAIKKESKDDFIEYRG